MPRRSCAPFVGWAAAAVAAGARAAQARHRPRHRRGRGEHRRAGVGQVAVVEPRPGEREPAGRDSLELLGAGRRRRRAARAPRLPVRRVPRRDLPRRRGRRHRSRCGERPSRPPRDLRGRPTASRSRRRLGRRLLRVGRAGASARPVSLHARPPMRAALSPGLVRPRGHGGRRLNLSSPHTGGALHRIRPTGGSTPPSLVPATTPYRPALTCMSANLAAAHRARVRIDLTSRTSSRTTRGPRGRRPSPRLRDRRGTTPQINPAVTALVPGADHAVTAANPPVLYADYNGGSHVFNGPVALAALGTATSSSRTVHRRRRRARHDAALTPDARAVATFPVGRGPAGVAVDEAHASPG